MPSAPCACCGGALAPRFPEVTDPQTGERFAIEHCTACGLDQTRPVPADLASYYAGDYYGGRQGAVGRWSVWRRIGHLIEATAGKTGGRLLDFGCGDGSFLLAARARGFGVSGAELEPSRARAAGLEVHTTASAASAGQTVITLWHSLEHVPDPPAALRQLCGLLEPGGLLLLAVPNAASAQARLFGRYWLHLDVPRHLFHFDSRSIDQLLKGAGLSPVLRWNQEFEYDLLGWVQSALNALGVKPNFLLKRLTGRKPAGSLWDWLATVALTPPLAVLATPAVYLSSLLGTGGTLLVAARKRA